METVKINFEKTASFDIDAQKGFTPICPDELPVPYGNTIVNELIKQAELAKYRIGSKDVHPQNAIWIASKDRKQFSTVVGENVDIRWNAHCMSGTKGAELLDGLPHVSEYDYFVFKGTEPDMHPYSPIYHDLNKKISTGVIEWARDKEITTFICGGLALNYCLGEGAIDLKKAGFEVIVNLSATKGVGTEEEINEYVEKLKELGIILTKNCQKLSLV
jgi:nicotinamidase/pyrazinamidase